MYTHADARRTQLFESVGTRGTSTFPVEAWEGEEEEEEEGGKEKGPVPSGPLPNPGQLSGAGRRRDPLFNIVRNTGTLADGGKGGGERRGGRSGAEDYALGTTSLLTVTVIPIFLSY